MYGLSIRNLAQLLIQKSLPGKIIQQNNVWKF